MSVGKDDWFCNARWDDAEKEMFYKKLSRARYRAPFIIRAKSVYLQRSGDSELVRESLLLLEDAMMRYPESDLISGMLLLSARAMEMLGDPSGAVVFYREIIKVQSDPNRNVRETTAWSDFALCVVRNRMERHYEEILSLVRAAPLLLIYQEFLSQAIQAVLLERLGKSQEAIPFRMCAKNLMTVTNSTLKGRPQLGLVDKDTYADLIAELEN